MRARVSAPVISHAPAGSSPDDFKVAFAVVLNRMLVSYKSKVKEPLRVEVLDMSAPGVRDFFSRISHSDSFDPHTVLALNFDRNAKVDGKPTAACILRYNTERREHLLGGYERSGLFNRQEILYYLAAHEFGHCMAFHQAALGNGPSFSAKDHELIADKVAIAFFMVSGQRDTAQKILRFNRDLVGGKLHHHPNELNDFYLSTVKALHGVDIRAQVSSLLDVYSLAIAQ